MLLEMAHLGDGAFDAPAPAPAPASDATPSEPVTADSAFGGAGDDAFGDGVFDAPAPAPVAAPAGARAEIPQIMLLGIMHLEMAHWGMAYLMHQHLHQHQHLT